MLSVRKLDNLIRAHLSVWEISVIVKLVLTILLRNLGMLFVRLGRWRQCPLVDWGGN